MFTTSCYSKVKCSLYCTMNCIGNECSTYKMSAKYVSYIVRVIKQGDNTPSIEHTTRRPKTSIKIKVREFNESVTLGMLKMSIDLSLRYI